jgi:serine/threonine protein kinase
VTKYLPDEKLEHGLVFTVPGPTQKTLSKIPEIEAESLDAGDWYHVARAVPRAVLYMHLVSWLHKGIRSDNVLFFAEDNGSFSYDKPYVVGFEYSRVASSIEQTESVTDDFELNLYRHPEMQGLPAVAEPAPSSNSIRIPFDYQHDHYSLGILLLELGLRESIKSVQKRMSETPGYISHSAVEFRDHIVNHEVSRLASKMGKGYRDGTRLCLSGSLAPTETTSIQEEFYLKIVRVLDDYRVH